MDIPQFVSTHYSTLMAVYRDDERWLFRLGWDSSSGQFTCDVPLGYCLKHTKRCIFRRDSDNFLCHLGSHNYLPEVSATFIAQATARHPEVLI